MQKVDLYRYTQNNVVIITPNKRNETDTPSRMRLIADEGFTLTNGEINTLAIDIVMKDVDLWVEVEDIDEATSLEQKAHAYDILTGVIE